MKANNGHMSKLSKAIKAWCLYDWANSAYSLIITSAIFPAYFVGLAPDKVSFLGMSLEKETAAAYTISLSFLTIVCISPLLAGLADYGKNKKRFMQLFTYIGAAACISLFFFTEKNIGFGLFLSY